MYLRNVLIIFLMDSVAFLAGLGPDFLPISLLLDLIGIGTNGAGLYGISSYFCSIIWFLSGLKKISMSNPASLISNLSSSTLGMISIWTPDGLVDWS